MNCDYCSLAWIGERPQEEDLKELYRQYHTHTGYLDNSSATGWKKIIKEKLLGAALGYGSLSILDRIVFGTAVCFRPAFDYVAGRWMWLARKDNGVASGSWRVAS